MTWQKLTPLWLIATVVYVEEVAYLMAVATVTAILGAWGGLNQTKLRPLMGYSSLVHLGWIISLLTVGDYSVLIYWGIYRTILAPPILSLLQIGIVDVKTLNNVIWKKNGAGVNFLFAISILSLAGMPPSRGFFLKVFAISELIAKRFFWPAIALVISSIIALAFYCDIMLKRILPGLQTSAAPSFCYSRTMGVLTSASLIGPRFVLYVQFMLK